MHPVVVARWRSALGRWFHFQAATLGTSFTHTHTCASVNKQYDMVWRRTSHSSETSVARYFIRAHSHSQRDEHLARAPAAVWSVCPYSLVIQARTRPRIKLPFSGACKGIVYLFYRCRWRHCAYWLPVASGLGCSAA